MDYVKEILGTSCVMPSYLLFNISELKMSIKQDVFVN